MRGSRILGLALAVPLLALPACENASVEPGQGATLSILLKDAPGAVQAAVVTIAGVYLQAEEGEDGGGRVWLGQEETTVDLLTLTNEVVALVDEALVPPGRYAQLRLLITGGYIAVEEPDGSMAVYASSPDYAGLPDGVVATGQLQMPSYAQSGLKVTLPGGALELGEEQKILLVDFDVAESFGQKAGKSGQWVMHPTIRAVDLTVTGGLHAVVRLADTVSLPAVNDTARTLADFKAVLEDSEGGDGVEVALTDEDQDGTFDAWFRYLVPGTYTLSLVGPAGLTIQTAPALPTAVTVPEGENVKVEVEVTAASTGG